MDGSSDSSAAGGVLSAALREHGSARTFRNGHALFSEGDVADRVFLIERGWITIRTSGLDGGEIIVGLRGPGEIVGELSAIDGQPRTATAVAIDEVVAVVAPARALTTALKDDPSAGDELVRLLAARLRESDRHRIEYTMLDTMSRVARRLLELAERFGEPTDYGIRVELPLSQEELASLCGSSREATVKALRTLREVAGVTTGRKMVELHDVAALRRHARLS